MNITCDYSTPNTGNLGLFEYIRYTGYYTVYRANTILYCIEYVTRTELQNELNKRIINYSIIRWGYRYTAGGGCSFGKIASVVFNFFNISYTPCLKFFLQPIFSLLYSDSICKHVCAVLHYIRSMSLSSSILHSS